MILGVDIDNVIAATDEVIRGQINSQYEIESNKEDIKYWFYHKSLPITEAQEEQIFTDFHHNHIRSVVVVNCSVQALTTLSKYFTIDLLTNRPKFTQEDTKYWLATHQIPYNSLFFTDHKIRMAASISLLIEDRGETALEFAETGVPVFLLDYPWNRSFNHENIKRVSNWEEITVILLNEYIRKENITQFSCENA